MAKVFVVTSGKGGVGKTTMTANIGGALALLGDKVVLIDADVGLKNLDVILGLENRIIYTLMDVVREKCETQEALVRHKQLRNLYLLPASQIATKEMLSPDDMKRIVADLEDFFDYVIVDSPAGIERGFRNAISAVKEAIVVTTPEIPSITDADRVIGLLENHGFDDSEIRLIINRVKPRMVRRGDMLTRQDVEEALAIKPIGIVPDSEEVIISTNKGKPIVMEDNSRLSTIFQNIAKRIHGEDIKLESMTAAEGGFWSFMRFLFGRNGSGKG